MATCFPRYQITARDLDVLTALDAIPMTAEQLLTYSRTFSRPFSQLRLVQRRLQTLKKAELVQGFPFAVASNGRSPYYFKLTRTGYRMLHGFDAVLPKRRYFERIADNHHFHTRRLADFLVTLAARCEEEGIVMERLARENTVAISTDSLTLYPDAMFRLRTPESRTFNFVVELDNGTERVRSRKDLESIERKIRGYDAHQAPLEAFSPQRYVVLFVTTRSEQRLKHILHTARSLVSNPQRRLFLGIGLDRWLSNASSATARTWLDMNLRSTSLVTSGPSTKTSPTFLTPRVAVC